MLRHGKKPKYPFMDEWKRSCGPHTLVFFNMAEYSTVCVCVAYKHTQWDVIQPYIYILKKKEILPFLINGCAMRASN